VYVYVQELGGMGQGGGGRGGGGGIREHVSRIAFIRKICGVQVAVLMRCEVFWEQCFLWGDERLVGQMSLSDEMLS
jgi:hypothetical protein